MRVIFAGPLPHHESRVGVSAYTEALASQLADRNDVEISVVTTSPSPKTLESLPADFEVHVVPVAPLPLTIQAPSVATIQIVRTIKRLNPDLLHGQMVDAPYCLETAAVVSRFPTVLTIHSSCRSAACSRSGRPGRFTTRSGPFS